MNIVLFYGLVAVAILADLGIRTAIEAYAEKHDKSLNWAISAGHILGLAYAISLYLLFMA